MFPNAENLPRPASPGAAKLGLERWREAAASLEDESVGRFARKFASDPAGQRLLEAVFGNSPFLGRCLLAELPFVQSLVASGSDAAFSGLLESTRDPSPAPSTAELMRALRIARRRAAIVVALADIAGLWPEPRVTAALSDFADAALGAAVRHLLREAAAAGALPVKHPDDPEQESGLAIFAMGKLGGRELNYSSDLDLIVLYDPARVALDDRAELQLVFNRLTRELLRILQEHTPHGYVFRIDLRLRPDPGATPPAMSVLAAETYYESLGQNWERAALIKARPVAGDRAAGAAFLAQLRPFIWRKNLDFAAIQDIHSIKRQIAAHRGGGRIAVAGHNIKLGRGGIREIEFFAQTQQLIFGGRDPRLRAPATCDALRALVASGRVGAEVADELIAAYWFLRRVEHRLQMIEDQQTHTIPPDPAAVEGLGAFLGFESGRAFGEALLRHLHAVEDHYAELFEEAPALSGPGNLVFTGGEHDPETLRTIAAMGFADAERVSTVVRHWHHGRYRATGSARAREILTELVPGLLASLAKTAEPDTALLRFNDFVAGLPAGVQIFSLFQANPQLLDLVARIMGSAPYLADRLARNSSLLDVLLDADSMTGPPDRAELESSLQDALGDARVFEDVLDIARRWTNERKFQMGMQILVDMTDGDAAGAAFSDTADVVLAATQAAVEAEFARRHGRVPGGALCVIAYGKHGGRELMPGSDLDAVFLFDCPDGAESSDGPRPLTPGHYFARLGQSLVSAVSAPTAEGKLYEIDLRLRPSGRNSPLVPQLDRFVRYQAENAWTWEHMALTRARPVTGSPELRARLAGIVREVLTRPRDPDRLVYDVAHMRRRMAEHHKAVSIWDIKHWRGGLVDIEFIAQYLMLRHAPERPEVLETNTTGALARLRDAGCLAPAVADRLIETMRLWRRVHAILRLTFGSKAFREEELPEDLRELLVQAGEADGFDALKDKLADAAAFAHNQFAALIEAPAAAVPVPEEQPREMPK